MDLLMDYNYIPATDKKENQFLLTLKNVIKNIAFIVKDKTEDYDFMDLLSNNGYVPVYDNWLKTYSNDNEKSSKIAS